MGLNTLGLGIVLSLRDNASLPANRATTALGQLDMAAQRFSQRFNTAMATAFEGMNLIAAGALAAAAPIAFIKSTFKTQKAMAAVASAGIKEMDRMKVAAEEFTNNWAGATQDQFFDSMYEIKSGLYELSDDAVKKMTVTTGILANATRTSMKELQELAPIMYGILRPSRKGVTDDQFIDEFAGGLAYAVKIYRATGKYFGDAFSQATSIASLQGVSMQEQMAVLGQLQQTMTGSEAGTKLKALAIAVPKAVPAMKKYDVKGLQLTDKNNMMLPIAEILSNIRNKYGDTLNATSMEELRKLFGSREATSAIANMLPYIEKIKKDTIDIKKAMGQGIPVALEMAKQATNNISDRWQLMIQRVDNLRQKIGEKLIPVFGPVIEILGKMIVYFQKIIEINPIIIQLTGAFLIFISVLLSSMGALFILSAVFQMINASLSLMKSRLSLLILEFRKFLIAMWPLMLIGGLLYLAFKTNFMGIADVFKNFMSSVKRFISNIALVWNGLRELISSLSNDSGMISEETKNALEDAGLWGLTKRLFMLYVRLQYMWNGIKQGFRDFSNTLANILKPIGGFFFKYLVEPISDALAKIGFTTLKSFVDSITKPSKDNVNTWKQLGYWIGVSAVALSALVIAAKSLSIFMSIVKFIAPLFKGIALAIRLIWGAFMLVAGALAFILGIPVWLSALIIAAVIGIVAILYYFWDECKAIFMMVVYSIAGVFSAIGMVIWAALQTIFLSVISIFSSIGLVIWGLVNVVLTVLMAVAGVFLTALFGILSIFRMVWELIKAVFFTAIEIIVSVFTGNFKGLGERLMAIWGNAMSNIKNIASQTVQAVVEIWEGIKIKFENIWTSLKESAGSFFDWIGSKFKWVSNSIDTIKNIGSWVKDGIGDAAASVGWKANGGLFNGPSIIGVGEAGNEAVIPLSGRAMMPFARAIADVMPGRSDSSSYIGSGPINNSYSGNNSSREGSAEAMISRLANQSNGGTKLITVEVPLYLDGRQVAKAVADHIDFENRR